ncbi:hypothetical protein EFD55_22325 [Rhizobium pisi]|uniref:Uncharacterized protein n=1 Tax=Rhizobium pisi TaxID=574561 RepID=A0A3R9A4P5_9HYPH|nr:hypothetical protein EFD55_22325 [Rhizobium pisi]
MTGFRKFITKWNENQIDPAENALGLVIFLAFPPIFSSRPKAQILVEIEGLSSCGGLYLSH